MVKPFRSIASPPQPELPTQLDAGDLAYLRRLIEEQNLSQAAMQKFCAHLAQRYQAGPQDTIDFNGVITRVPVEDPK